VHTGPAGGHLARQGRVRVPGGAPALFDDVFGGPGALIARSSLSLTGLPGQALKELGIDLVALSGPGTAGVTVVEDLDGVYATWLDALAADAVLVRPDFHLYGAGNEAAALAAGLLNSLVAAAPVATA
jgi:3-(3-hydroxy-phenyl)propionate hydroxylase